MDIFVPVYATFPQKLYALINAEPRDVVCWTEKGNAFKVVDVDKFSDNIIPKYFRHTKITSFQRQLNLYGFRRITKGEDVGAYYHPKFLRGQRELVCEIKRLPGKHSRKEDGDVPKQKRAKSITLNGNHKNKEPSSSTDDEFPKPMNIKDLPGTSKSNTVDILKDIPLHTLYYDPLASAKKKHNIKVPKKMIIDESTLPMKLDLKLNKTLTDLNTSILSSPKNYTPKESSQEATDEPILSRNFSVSSAFDTEYRLPAQLPGIEQTGITRNSITRNDSLAFNIDKPVLARDESESWVQLSALDQQHDMDPIDIEEIVFTSENNKEKNAESNGITF